MAVLETTLRNLDTIIKDPNESRHHKRIALAQKRAYKHAISEISINILDFLKYSIVSLYRASDEDILPVLTRMLDIYLENYLKRVGTPFKANQHSWYITKTLLSLIPEVSETYVNSQDYIEDEEYNYEHERECVE